MKDAVKSLPHLVLVFFIAAVRLRAQQSQPPSSAPPPVTFETRAVSLGKVPVGFREESLVVSSDGQRLACAAGDFANQDLEPYGTPLVMMAEHKRKVRIVLDGVEGPGYDGVGIPVFSPDGRRMAHAVLHGSPSHYGEAVVVDGVEGRRYVAVSRPVFSPDSRHVAYCAGRLKLAGRISWRLALDDTEREGFNDVQEDPVFSSADAEPAYLARDGGKHVVVNGGRVTPGVPADMAGRPVISADGTRLAYIALRNRRFSVVVDGKESRDYDWISGLVFSTAGPVAYAARQDGRAFISVESESGESSANYRDVGDPVFSPDGRRMAYWAWDGSKVRIVVDQVVGMPYDEVGQLLFGPDGRHLAAEVRVGSRWSLVVDGVVGPEFAPTKRLTGIITAFAPKEPRSTGLRCPNGWRFARPDLLEYVGVKGGEFVRLEVQVNTTQPATRGGE